MARSQNGWTANDVSATSARTVPGSRVRLRVRDGVPGDLLLEVARFFDQKVEDIDGDASRGLHMADDWGYASRPIRGSSRLSNHASGTAIDLNATRHPLGARGTFTSGQKLRMHAFLRELEGTVRWGEDYIFRKDGMHFELMSTDTARLARALKTAKALNAPEEVHAPGSRVLTYRKRKKVMVGDDVKIAQRAMGVLADGYYGPATMAAVKRYQKRKKIKPVSGDVGPRTWRSLGVTMEK